MGLTPLQLRLLSLMIGGKLIAASALAFTPTSSLRYRGLATAAIVGIFSIFYHDSQLLKVVALRIALNTFSIIQVGNIVDVLLISRLEFPASRDEIDKSNHHSQDQTQEIPKPEPAGLLDKLSWGFKAIGNFRGVGTPQQVKGVPRFQKDDPSFVPSRGYFLFRRGLSIAVRMLVLKAWGPGWPLLSPAVDLAYPRQFLFSRITDVSSPELLIRTWATCLFWIRGYLNHSIAYDMLSIFFVASNVSDPKNWPPMYGSLTDCYTIRTWWGSTWHQLLRKQLSSISNLAVYDVLRLTKGTLMARYAVIFMTFWVSGVYHIFSDGFDIESGVMRFFLMQAAGILVEDAAQGLLRRSGWGLSALCKRVVGYVWVATFLAWTSPGWRYPVVTRLQYEAFLPT